MYKDIIKLISGDITKIDEKDIEKYLESGEGDDKAAAYAIQGKGSLFIKGIKGDYFNVVGLPIYTLKVIWYKEIKKLPSANQLR